MTDEPQYLGWVRQAGKRKWLLVAQGSYDHCRNAISDHARQNRWSAVESLLTAPGTDPNLRKVAHR